VQEKDNDVDGCDAGKIWILYRMLREYAAGSPLTPTLTATSLLSFSFFTKSGGHPKIPEIDPLGWKRLEMGWEPDES